MTYVNRRQFLSRAVLGGAGVVSAATLGPLAPSTLADTTTTPREAKNGGANPNFAEGKIISIDGSVVVVQSSGLLLQRIQITAATRIWKARDTTLQDVQVNDRLYSRGVPGADGTFIAETVWVNIVSLHLSIGAIQSDRLSLNQVHFGETGEQLIGHVVPETVVIKGIAPPTRDLSTLKVGAHVQIIGAWHPDTNEIDLVKIFVPS